ncbi:MAG: glucose-1-phosphate adenylyltransferase family protein [bacterium]
MRNVLVVILAGGAGDRLSVLSERRAKPAVPFGGKFRLIDFTLSNCVNSGLSHIVILTQYRPRSLEEHIGIGKPWDLDRREGGIEILQPHINSVGSFWYRGTADAIYHNSRYIASRKVPNTLILSGDHVYKMDYRFLIQYGIEKDADLVISSIEVDKTNSQRFGIIVSNSDGRIVEFQEKPKLPKSLFASMGVYLFKTDVLLKAVALSIERGGYDFGKDVIPFMLNSGYKIFMYLFKGYWRDVGTCYSFWEANMDLIDEPPKFNLNDPAWPIFTQSFAFPPVKFGHNSQVEKSIIGGGAIVEGHVKHSVVHKGVVIHKGAFIEDSVLMDDVIVGPGVVVRKAIIDKLVVIGEGAKIGVLNDDKLNEEIPDILEGGLTLIGRKARITPGAIVGKNCIIYPNIGEEEVGNFVGSGKTIRGKQQAE